MELHIHGITMCLLVWLSCQVQRTTSLLVSALFAHVRTLPSRVCGGRGMHGEGGME